MARLANKLLAAALLVGVIVLTVIVVRHAIRSKVVQGAVETVSDAAIGVVDKVADAVETEVLDDDGDDEEVKGVGEYAPTVLDAGSMHPESLASVDGPTTLSDDL
jgi:formaldehyde-activating enzyme involved in methanogenesis